MNAAFMTCAVFVVQSVQSYSCTTEMVTQLSICRTVVMIS